MYITSREGYTFDAADVPDEWDLAFCSNCGERIGWFNNELTEQPVCLCDYCAGHIKEDQEEEEEYE